MINNITIKNYKNYRNFRIDNLRRFNLFVGDNNAGKSNLLEALALYADGFNRHTIYTILQHRYEDTTCFDKRGNYSEILQMEMFAPMLPLRSIDFFKKVEDNSIVLASGKDIIQLALVKAYSKRTPLGENTILQFSPYGQMQLPNMYSQRTAAIVRRSQNQNTTFETIKTAEDNSIFDVFWFDKNGFMVSDAIPRRQRIPYVFIDCKRLNTDLFVREWNKIVLTDAEELLNEIINKFYPEVQRIATVKIADDRYVPFLLLKNGMRIPMTAVGNGVLHAMTIILGCLQVHDGFLLLDEPEAGIHYAAQKQLWDMLSIYAREWNVQIFATTHSTDCALAFTDGKKDEEVSVTRLEYNNGEVEAIQYPDLETIRYSLLNTIEIR